MKNIKTLAPFLADSFVDLDEPIFDADHYLEFINKGAERLGLFKKYVICKLHDSKVIDVKQSLDRLTITLNDFSTCVFAAAINDKYKLSIEASHILFPLTIELFGDVAIEYNLVDNKGELKQISPTEIDEYLYEQVTQIDTKRIGLVFCFWKSNLKENKPGEKIVIIASAKNLNVLENQDQAWKEIFRHEYDKLYHYFKKQFDRNRYVSDRNECEKLIEEYLTKNK